MPQQALNSAPAMPDHGPSNINKSGCTARPRDMVVFAEDWEGLPASTHHLVRSLADDRRVLWVNSLGLRRPRLNAKDASRAISKLTTAFSGRAAITKHQKHIVRHQAERPTNLEVLAPVAVSWPASKLAFGINKTLLSRQLRKETAARNFAQPILWISLPSALPVVGTLNEHALVYYCADDWGSLVGVDHAPILEMERRIVERADLIIAASDVLAERFPPEKTMLVTHGTDIGHFSKPAERAADLPASDKIAGFYGSIDDRLNLEMLAQSATQLSDWSFILVGPVKTDLSPIAGHPNIHVLGPRPYSALPGYVQHWQVSMILYRYDEQVRAGNPLKMREYLAAGTPIATIDVPALKPYENVLSISRSSADFADAIVRAANDADRNALRKQSISGDSWQARAKLISERLERL